MTATARIDPRLRARRVAVIRGQGRRRLRILLGAMTLVVLVVAAWLVVQSPLLDVERIAVHGTQDVTEPDVRAAAGVQVGDPLVLVDAGAVERRVEAVPGIGEAHVRRDLPDGLRITVVERAPAAWARRATGSIALVAGSGHVISEVADPPPGLPELVGLARVPAAGGEVAPARSATILDHLPAALRARTTGVLTLGDQVTLRLDDGVEIRFGSRRGAADKARTALAVLEANSGRPIAYVDVSVAATPATG